MESRSIIGLGRTVTLVALFCLASLTALAAEKAVARSPTQFLEDLFTQSTYPDSWFSDSFLSKVSPAEVQTVVEKLTKEYGAFEGVDLSADRYFVSLKGALIPVDIAFDADGRVTYLRAKSAIIKYADYSAAEKAFGALPGGVSLLVLKDGQQKAAIKPDAMLAVGSAFKLAVINAVVKDINDGKLTWDTVAKLEERWRALPSGILQEWPPAMPFTVESLAGLMISLSDNTAADTLIGLVGRDAVEAFAPDVQPFLTPREFFILKDPSNHALRERYVKGDLSARRQVLKELETLSLPAVAEVASVYSPVVEWHFTVRQLCELLDPVSDQPVMQINSGIAIAEQWARVAFKGGGDVGVVNLTTQLVADDGTVWCAAVTWNNPDGLKEDELFPIYAGLLQLLKTTDD